VKTPDSLEISEIHPYEKRFSDNVFIGYETPISTVQAVIPIIPHHEVMSSGHRAGKPFQVVTA
jgi:hypothetical protein